MRKVGLGHVFDNPRVKREMLILRIRGYSYVLLSRRYNVDHTTIVYHCNQAGICLKEDVRRQMFQLIKNNIPFSDISKRLGILEEVIKFYIGICGINGDKVFSRRVPGVYKQIIKLPPKVERPIEKVKIANKKEEPLLTLTRTDSRGVEWVPDNRGGWICAGRPKEVIPFDEENKKKKALELKRLQMLAY